MVRLLQGTHLANRSGPYLRADTLKLAGVALIMQAADGIANSALGAGDANRRALRNES